MRIRYNRRELIETSFSEAETASAIERFELFAVSLPALIVRSTGKRARDERGRRALQ